MKQLRRLWKRFQYLGYHRNDQWEYTSASAGTLPEMNEWGAQGWEVYQIDTSYKPASIFMKRRVRYTFPQFKAMFGRNWPEYDTTDSKQVTA